MTHITIQEDTIRRLHDAKIASKRLLVSTNEERNSALNLIAEELVKSKNEILLANKKDLEDGKRNNLPQALLDRLLLNEKMLDAMAESIKKVISQPDPIGKVQAKWKHPNGMDIKK